MQKGEEFNRSDKDRKVRFWKRCVNVLTETERFDFTILLVIHVFADFFSMNICRIIAPPAKAAGEAKVVSASDDCRSEKRLSFPLQFSTCFSPILVARRRNQGETTRWLLYNLPTENADPCRQRTTVALLP